jgi:hypothetical protein
MENGDFHFFASSFVAWRVAATKEELIDRMNRLDHCGDGYRIYKVPLPLEAHYKINYYKPVVEGLEYVEEIPAN